MQAALIPSSYACVEFILKKPLGHLGPEITLNLSLQTIENKVGLESEGFAISAGLRLEGEGNGSETIRHFLHALWTAFADPFTLVDVETGEIVHADFDGLPYGLSERIGLLSEVVRRGRPEIVEDVSPLVMLAIPLPQRDDGPKLVAVGVFAQLQVEHEHQVAAAAKAIGVDASKTFCWLLGREIWSPRILQHLAAAVVDKFNYQNEVTRLRCEINESVDLALDTQLELGQLHRFTDNQHLLEKEAKLWQNALAWLSDSVQTQCLAIVANQAGEDFELAKLFAGLVQSMTHAMDAKDHYISGHIDCVAKLSVALAKQMGLDNESLETIHLGGLLHDVGKIGIDDSILNKPGPLTAEEYEQVKQHPQFGYSILNGIRQLDEVLSIVLHHHENWDGSGYPHRLAGNEIPIMARIVAVADAFDAMASNRPYREGLSDEEIDSILRDGAGVQWDARVVEAFFTIRSDIRLLTSHSSTQETSPNEVLVVN